MQVRRDVMAQQGEEAGNREGLVAVAQDLEVDGVQVEVVREEGDGRVDGNHEEDTNDTTVPLFSLTRVGRETGVGRLTVVAPMVSSSGLRVAISGRRRQ